MNLNKAILIGRLTRDPEIRVMPSGQQVANFGLATDSFYTDKNTNQRQQKTEFHNIVMFSRLAEIAGQYLKKGSLIMVEGRIQTRDWQDQAGNKRYRTEIVADNLQMGPRPAGDGGQSSAPQEYRPKPAASANPASNQTKPPPAEADIPIIEEDSDIDVKNIPF